MLHPLEIAALALSLKVSLFAVAIILVPGIAAGWLLARRDFPGKAIFDGLVHLPLVVPPVVIGVILLFLLSPGGPIGGLLQDSLGLRIAFTWQGAALAAGIVALVVIPAVIAACRATRRPAKRFLLIWTGICGLDRRRIARIRRRTVRTTGGSGGTSELAKQATGAVTFWTFHSGLWI